jgi:hypothetical protein
MKRWLVVGGLSIVLGYWFLSPSEVRHGPGVLVPEEPEQRDPSDSRAWEAKGYTIRPLAEFRIKARVIRREDYWMGRESDISPVDFVMGWGPMSDESILDRLDITQRSRWYYWSARKLPVAPGTIQSHSANMHMIPGDELVEDLLDGVRAGEVVQIRGYLVQVEAADGWRWRSSLSRTDKGGGSCEVVWVKDLYTVSSGEI